MTPPATLHVRATRLPVSARMPLTDVNGVRLARGVDTQTVWRATDGMMWVWDIAAANGRNQCKRALRYLVDEVADPTGNGVILQTPTQIVNRLLGERAAWSVTDLSNLLLCSKEHIHALLRAKPAGLVKSTKGKEPIRVARASLERFLLNRLVNK